jgi:putative SOS response-associated peptidase YedK
MCGRFTLAEIEALGARFGIAVMEDDSYAEPRPRFNVAPGQQIPVIVETDEGRALRWMEWGFRPGWFKPSAKQPPPINARAETLGERPMFRGALQGGRCLIPADGFYEWQALPGQRAKQPLHIRRKDRALFGFAGLFTERRDDASGDQIASCAIITTTPNAVMAPIHHRMPVILDPDDEALWLDTAAHDVAAARTALRSYSDDWLEAFPVSPLVSSVRNEGPELLQPALFQ